MEYLRKLRGRAEALLAVKDRTAQEPPAEEIRQLAHDLAVHQVELEIQNEELQAAYQRIDAALGRYAQLYHQAPVGFLTLDANGVILQCNQTFRDLLGPEQTDPAGTSLAHFLESPGREILLGRFRAFFNAPEGKSLEARLPRKGRGVLDLRLTGRQETEAGPGEGGPGQRLLVAVHDISAEKQAEQAFRDAHQFNAQIVQGAGEGVVVYGPDLRYRSWNPFMERLTGFPAQDVLGRHPRRSSPSCRRPESWPAWNRCSRAPRWSPWTSPSRFPGPEARAGPTTCLGPCAMPRATSSASSGWSATSPSARPASTNWSA